MEADLKVFVSKLTSMRGEHFGIDMRLGLNHYHLQFPSLAMVDSNPNPLGSNRIKRKYPGTTDLAKKYSAPRTGQHNTLIGFEPLKSGISSLELGPFLIWKEFVDFYVLERYQRDRLKGTTQSQITCCIGTCYIEKDSRQEIFKRWRLWRHSWQWMRI